ncbi:hypothetical protein [Nonlabens antarcticus]|uniref:hypothetical protein n=1 Tax=Nonlabens antarcticus TaxID=392714 RepID=UPI00189185B3|nr:hypothetical protein [Nonlabens antarcticus]
MKTKLLLVITMFVLLCSCTDTVANFKVVNTTDEKIENFIIEPSGSTNVDFVDIDPRESIKYEVNLADVPKTDGHYTLSYQKNGKNVQEKFGYYTNGLPLDGTVRIEILPLIVRITPVSN